MSKEVSYEDLAQTIDQLFAKNRQSDEDKIDINAYSKVLVRESLHHIICKNSSIFDLWIKIKKANNLIKLVNDLEKQYPSSTFTIKKYDNISSYIACEIHPIDFNTTQISSKQERDRYIRRSEVLHELEVKQKTMKEEYVKAMTLLNQKALELQEKYEKKIRELKNQQALERIEIDNIINSTPKRYEEEMNTLTETIALLKKCSHGFMYEGTIFTKDQ